MKKFTLLFLILNFMASVYLSVCLFFELTQLHDSINFINEHPEAVFLPESIAHYYCSLPFLVISIILSITCFVICLISLIKGTNILSFTRLTYEEYKELREKKKQEKQDKKAQKLQAELEKIKSTK